MNCEHHIDRYSTDSQHRIHCNQQRQLLTSSNKKVHIHHREESPTMTVSHSLSSFQATEDLVIKRQKELLVEKEHIRLTPQQRRIFLRHQSFQEAPLVLNLDDDSANGDKQLPLQSNDPFSLIYDNDCFLQNANSHNFNASNEEDHLCDDDMSIDSYSNHKRFSEKFEKTKMNQFRNNYQEQNRHQYQKQVSILYPRDDNQSKVRFKAILSVYDHNHNGTDKYNSHAETSVKQFAFHKNKESSSCSSSFKSSWYSKSELLTMKNKQKLFAQMIRRKKNPDLSFSIDDSDHTIRGLESYCSGQLNEMLHKNRKEVWQSVFYEQERQKNSHRSSGNRNNPHRINNNIVKGDDKLRIVSTVASEWARTRAYEIAKADAIEAEMIYHNRMNESYGLMDIGDKSDSALAYWANSSWTQKKIFSSN